MPCIGTPGTSQLGAACNASRPRDLSFPEDCVVVDHRSTEDERDLKDSQGASSRQHSLRLRFWLCAVSERVQNALLLSRAPEPRAWQSHGASARWCSRCFRNWVPRAKLQRFGRLACVQAVADGVFYAELNELLMRELGGEGYSGVEVSGRRKDTARP